MNKIIQFLRSPVGEIMVYVIRFIFDRYAISPQARRQTGEGDTSLVGIALGGQEAAVQMSVQQDGTTTRKEQNDESIS
ncbi:hypothetical protein [Megasphaera hutchinsoni]|uniref:Uncharacterized protein n=2 Tax=Megasphaera hutchinsoni TaxID=1588748 RepID=A0A134CLV7_9FIRM|nr:hypothetical protein [Megasphaera hutchinsoni]KXB93134.1 hypothetical protein HMPREF3182_00050 [Megasphaera hutchinsoni]MUP47971.1 hypothetical protein [Veillonellaceae bacterium M2-8]MUP58634.1 hypothetical protein [Veillonellaceae bacterium M2-4]